MGYMTPWRNRKGKDAQLAASLRSHLETMWAISCTLTGDEGTAREIVREVVRGTLPQPYRLRQRGLRLEVVIAATEASAARVFAPLVHKDRSGSYAAALGPQASALRRAFSRRLSWDVQALLWATDVEGIDESDVVQWLGPMQGREDGLVALHLAYLDLRRDLDVNCRATLRRVFASRAGTEKRADDAHLTSCARCQAESRWLTDLRTAFLSPLPTMPPEVWDEAQQHVLEVPPVRPTDQPHSDAATTRGDAMSERSWLSEVESPANDGVAEPPSADQADAAADDATTALLDGGERPIRGEVEAPMEKVERFEAQKTDARKGVDSVLHL
jgi:hypothetical protein